MTRWLALATAGALAMLPMMLHAQTTATPGSGSKVEPTQGSKPAAADTMARPAETGKAATPGSGSKVEATSGSTGTSETPPTTAGSSDTGSRDITPGAGAQPTDKQYPTEKALSASPGPDKQGDSAGPAVPPKKD
jgi:hypothetical protein